MSMRLSYRSLDHCLLSAQLSLFLGKKTTISLERYVGEAAGNSLRRCAICCRCCRTDELTSMCSGRLDVRIEATGLALRCNQVKTYKAKLLSLRPPCCGIGLLVNVDTSTEETFVRGRKVLQRKHSYSTTNYRVVSTNQLSREQMSGPIKRRRIAWLTN